MIRRPFAGVLLAGVLLAAAGFALATPAAAATRHSLATGDALTPTQSLRSSNGLYTLTLRRGARLVVTDRSGHWVWATRSYHVSHSRLVLRPHGDAVLSGAGRVLWRSGTAGVSHLAALVMRDDGELVVRTPWGTAWSSRTHYRCGSYRSGKRVMIDLSEQYAWMCRDHQQVQTTAITSGAVDRGMGTPTGTWHLQSKQHERYLYPASGGAYYVQYWMPYDFDFGMHDSSWQNFAYGSPRYRSEGSHGCVHVPLRVIRWLDGWAPLGTTVHIRA